MTLHLNSSAHYFKIGDRVFDKITEEYNPPSYWFRVKVSATGHRHEKCSGQITNFWTGNGRRWKGFDPLTLLWLNEPLQDDVLEKSPKYFHPDIAAGTYELAGLLHVKLPLRSVDPNLPLPEKNIPDEQLPEVKLNVSSKEPKHTSKRISYSYGIYYLEVTVVDKEGSKVRKVFKIWAFRDVAKCRIRTSRFYERALIGLKSFLAPI